VLRGFICPVRVQEADHHRYWPAHSGTKSRQSAIITEAMNNIALDGRNGTYKFRDYI
jgi:hypothetical protein